jgi:SulP family sulfate permease
MRHHRNRPDLRPLRRAGLDRVLTRPQLDRLAAHTDVVDIGAGVTLARAGRKARQFLAVIDGHVDVDDRSGRRWTAGPGTHIGADELVTDEPHSETVIARTDCTLVVIFGPAFRAFARHRPEQQGAEQVASRQPARRPAIVN